MVRVVGVDEGGLGLGVIVIFVLVLLGLSGLKRIYFLRLIFWAQLIFSTHYIFPHLVGDLGLGRGLAPAGNVGSVKDPKNISSSGLIPDGVLVLTF